MRIAGFFFFKQKTAYEIVSGDWSSDVCSSDLGHRADHLPSSAAARPHLGAEEILRTVTVGSITDAVILMAGTGSRLRGSANTIAKPLIPIAGRPLISYAIESFDKAGVTRLHAVVGPNGDELAAAVAPLLPAHMKFHPIANPNWQKQNGVSLLTAAGKVNAPFFLAMGDHLFESSILDAFTTYADLTR